MQILYLLSKKVTGSSHVGSEFGQNLKRWAELVGKVWSAPISILNGKSDVPTRYVPERDSRIPQRDYSDETDQVLIQRWRNWIENKPN